MDQLGDELKKVLQAGLGAVATGVEKAQEAVENLSKKGEPLYEQAKSAVLDAAGKVKQAVSECGKVKVEDIIDTLRQMQPEDWAQVRAALDEFEALRAAEAAPDAEAQENQEPEKPEE